MHGLSHFFQIATAVVFPLIKDDLGVSYVALGGTVALYYVVSGICQTAAGFAVDRFGAPRVLFLGLILSTSGALIPRHLFARQYKLQFDQYFSRIGYSGNHEKSVMAVLNHNADAAFVASTNLSRMISDGQLKKSDVRVLWRSGPIPFDPFVYRGQLCADIRNKIREVFLDKNALRVKLALDNLRATHFVPVRDADYQIIRALP